MAFWIIWNSSCFKLPLPRVSLITLFFSLFLLAMIYLALDSTRLSIKTCSLPNADGLVRSHSNITAYGLKLAAEYEGTRLNYSSGISLKRQILLVAYHRGGSTFLGELLNAYPGAFLHFEPLYLVTGNDQVSGPDESEQALQLLQNIFHCQFAASTTKYQKWAINCLWYFTFNLPLVSYCEIQGYLCFSPAFLHAWCSAHTIQVAKVVRMRLHHAKHLLETFPDLRVVHLIRDPRGLYNSRRKWKWCTDVPSCSDPSLFCEGMRNDIAVAETLRHRFPDRFTTIQYENLALDTENQVRKLLDFLQLPPHEAVDAFVRSHTRSENLTKNDNWLLNTVKESKQHPYLWKTQLSRTDVDYVENACDDVIKHLS